MLEDIKNAATKSASLLGQQPIADIHNLAEDTIRRAFDYYGFIAKSSEDVARLVSQTLEFGLRQNPDVGNPSLLPSAAWQAKDAGAYSSLMSDLPSMAGGNTMRFRVEAK